MHDSEMRKFERHRNALPQVGVDLADIWTELERVYAFQAIPFQRLPPPSKYLAKELQ